MRKVIMSALTLAGAVVAVGLALNGRNKGMKGRRSLKDRFHASPFAIVAFIFGFCSYYTRFKIIWNYAV